MGDRVGGIVFDDDRQIEFVPKRSRRTAYALLETIAEFVQGMLTGKRRNLGIDRRNLDRDDFDFGQLEGM